jgi:hypothetical protein
MNVNPKIFSGRESTDSMRAASGRMSIPLDRVKSAKRQGCPAFRQGRVYLRELAEWLETDTRPAITTIEVPTGPGATPEQVERFQQFMRGMIRECLPPAELIGALSDRLFAALGVCVTSGGHAPTVFETLLANVSLGFAAVLIATDREPATDEFLQMFNAKVNEFREMSPSTSGASAAPKHAKPRHFRSGG